MAKEIEIYAGSDRKEGVITLDENPVNLQAERTAAGFKLRLPIKIGFYSVLQEEPMPMLGNLSGRILAGDSSDGSKREVGQVHSDSWFTSYQRSKDNPSSLYQQDADLIWQGVLAELAVYEKIRDGRVPQLWIELQGEFCYLLYGAHPHHGVRTEPRRFFSRHGLVQISYPREVWIKMLQNLGVTENVLVEVPLPKSPPAPWDGVWENLVAARNHFAQGGTTGWSSTILAVRQALEKWRAIEAPNTGPTNSQQRSKRERLDNLRQALHQCTHVWVHKDDECSRDDALLMLSTLSALLAERRP